MSVVYSKVRLTYLTTIEKIVDFLHKTEYTISTSRDTCRVETR